MLCSVYKHSLKEMSRTFRTYLNILAVNGQTGEVRFDLLLAHVSGGTHVMIADESLYPGQIRPLGFEEVVFSAQHIDDDCKRLLVPRRSRSPSGLFTITKYQYASLGIKSL